ncbi:hypothetical protein EH244_09390 [Variovorax beijingensis]|uniref:Uncharacterized protein n=1 Tax=Variovorax beijingensis TaxID=2496117 RepID=A0A3P3EUT2_9BURK|nr:hypothetical protein [Variovorax beijingensis]RRH89786.1 hypothetical protein EH244_09390 [Variovorax beijingensis]
MRTSKEGERTRSHTEKLQENLPTTLLAKTEASQQKMLAQEAGGKEDYPHALRYQGSLKLRGNQKR